MFLKNFLKVLAFITTLSLFNMEANAQRFPRLGDLLPGRGGEEPASTGSRFPDIGDLIPESGEESSPIGKIFAGGAGCTLVGAVGYFGTEELTDRYGGSQNITEDEAEQLKLGAALAGCAVGAAAGLAIVENMSETAKQAQEDAWLQAQTQVGEPIEWQDPEDPSVHGTTQLEIDLEPLPSGERCGFRRDIIESVEGTASPLSRVCKNDDVWEVQLG